MCVVIIVGLDSASFARQPAFHVAELSHGRVVNG